MTSKENLEEKYWIEEDGICFEFYPSLGKVVCHSDMNLLKAIHFVGNCGLDIDWTTLTKDRTFLVKYEEESSYQEYYIALRKLQSRMESKDKVEKVNLLKNNIDNKTGKSLNINSIRVMIVQLKKDIKSKKKTRKDIPKFFNRFNIEEDEERIKRGGSILKLTTKSANTLIEEGKSSLERLFKKGKLIRLTREEYNEKMLQYGE